MNINETITDLKKSIAHYSAELSQVSSQIGDGTKASATMRINKCQKLIAEIAACYRTLQTLKDLQG